MRSEGACEYGFNQDVERERHGWGGIKSCRLRRVCARAREENASWNAMRRTSRRDRSWRTTKGRTGVNSGFEYVMLVSSASVMLVAALGIRKSRHEIAKPLRPTSVFSLGILTTLRTIRPTAARAARYSVTSEREEQHTSERRREVAAGRERGRRLCIATWGCGFGGDVAREGEAAMEEVVQGGGGEGEEGEKHDGELRD
ncbi:hypothetical protein C8R45DRAFT_1184905 [Mycena sanguinolenta]|nr:hypothetical protein C8R45DRAFT_1184905 [Mycena sanguinolenta]